MNYILLTVMSGSSVILAAIFYVLQKRKTQEIKALNRREVRNKITEGSKKQIDRLPKKTYDGINGETKFLGSKNLRFERQEDGTNEMAGGDSHNMDNYETNDVPSAKSG